MQNDRKHRRLAGNTFSIRRRITSIASLFASMENAEVLKNHSSFTVTISKALDIVEDLLRAKGYWIEIDTVEEALDWLESRDYNTDRFKASGLNRTEKEEKSIIEISSQDPIPEPNEELRRMFREAYQKIDDEKSKTTQDNDE